MSVLICPKCRAEVTVPPGVESGGVTCGTCGEAITLEAAPAAAPPPVPATYPVTKFVAQRGGNAGTLVVPLIAGVIAAIVLGILCGFGHSAFWLIVLFPLLHGCAVGGLTGLGARLAKVRLPVLLGAVGAGCGLLSWFVAYLTAFLVFTSDPQVPPMDFFQYMDVRAQVGVQIGKAGGGNVNKPANLGYTGTLIYWGIEALLTAAAAGVFTVIAINHPFCETCNVWKRKRKFGPYQSDPATAAASVSSGIPAGIVVPAEAGNKVEVTVYSCPHCHEDDIIDVSVLGTYTEGKKTTTWKCFMTYPGEAMTAFETADAEYRALRPKKKKKK